MTVARVTLRLPEPSDWPAFLDHHRDAEARWMAAFTPPNPDDEAAIVAHWERLTRDPAIVFRTIVADGQVAGNLVAFTMFDERNVGYWLGREFWGRGIATQALRLFLSLLTERPLFARTAFDNAGSQRVLEHCGFRLIGHDTGYANAREAEIEECVFRLD
jgi:RimJ/RimL family protein N-acetyltransferase